MVWKLAAAGSLLAGIWQFYTSSESNRRAVTLLAGLGSGLFNPEQATSELHDLMGRESMREPYGSATGAALLDFSISGRASLVDSAMGRVTMLRECDADSLSFATELHGVLTICFKQEAIPSFRSKVEVCFQ